MKRHDTVAGFIKRAEKLKVEIGAKRNQLRDLISDMESIEDDVEVAADALESAIDTLTRGVETLSQYL